MTALALRFVGMRAVLRREFRGYFASPLGYIFIVIFLIASGYLMVSRDFGRFLEMREANLDALFSYLPWIFVVLCRRWRCGCGRRNAGQGRSSCC